MPLPLPQLSTGLSNNRQPNDEEEQDRMDLAHHVYRLLLGGPLHLAPIKNDVQRVLDLGTGTGIWAIDFAEYVHGIVIIQTSQRARSLTLGP